MGDLDRSRILLRPAMGNLDRKAILLCPVMGHIILTDRFDIAAFSPNPLYGVHYKDWLFANVPVKVMYLILKISQYF